MTRENKPSNNQKAGLTSLEAALLREARRQITVTNNGRSEQISMEQALIKRKYQAALQGSPHALHQTSKALQEAEAAELAYIRNGEEEAETYRQHGKKLIRQAINKGEDPRLVIPHPDDVRFDPETGNWLHGPAGKPDHERIFDLLDVIDLLILQDTLEQRTGSNLERTGLFPAELEPSEPAIAKSNQYLEDELGEVPDLDTISSPLLIAMVLNDFLPQRFRLSRNEVMDRILVYSANTKRDLLKLTTQRWRKHGHPRPRGWHMPKATPVIAWLHALPDLLHWLKANTVTERDGKVTTPGIREIADKIQATG